MENQPRHFELGSRICKEDFKTSWRISGFNLMPFQDDHPVYGPWFVLGKNRESPWSVLITKEVHGGVKNVGFRLVRAEENTRWDMVTFSLGLKLEDGRFVKCIDKQVVGKESNNSYVYLVKPIESQLKEHVTVKRSDYLPALRELANALGELENALRELSKLLGELVNQISSSKVRDLCGILDRKNLKDGSIMNGSCGIRLLSGKSSHGLKESSAVKGSTKVEDDSYGEGPCGVKEPTDVEIERSVPEIISKIIISIDSENRSMSCVQATLKELSVINNSTEASKIDEDVKKNPMPEELFQQETITVVCEIEYTYMIADPIPRKEVEQDQELVSNFGYLFASGKFSDITLKCGNVNLPCHKAVLCTKSRLFEQFLEKAVSCSGPATSEHQHLIVNVALDLPILKAILLYMYTHDMDEEIGMSEDNCWKLYKAAGLFGIPGLRSLCLDILDETDDICVDDSKDFCEKLSVLSICTSDQKDSVVVLTPVTSISTQTTISD